MEIVVGQYVLIQIIMEHLNSNHTCEEKLSLDRTTNSSDENP
jgi:hypothetical protein